MNNSFSDAFSLQGRVLWALCLREIHGRHGRFRIGYLWQLIRAVFGIGVFWWVREMGNFHPPQGMATPVFLLLGFVPWFIFSEGMSMVMEAVRTNKALLTFPQVTPLDLCLGSWIVAAATQIVVLAVFLAGIAIVGYDIRIHDFPLFIAAISGITLLTLGLGLFLAALNLYLPLVENIVPMVMRIMFLITGVFFSPVQMASLYGDAIMWLPTANYIEMLRGSFSGTGIPDLVKVEYTVAVTVISLVLGLLLERHVRPKHEVV